MACKVLIVEDDKPINDLVAYNLSRAGIEVKSCYDGTSARGIIDQEHFDAVILDIMLPGIDGFSLCRHIKSEPGNYNLFVVILSARAEALDKVYANILGADYYLTKPFSPLFLVQLIKGLVALRDNGRRVLPKAATYLTKGGGT